MNQSDEIKSRLDIVDIIRDYVRLKPAGMNFSAPCPFHSEKTPSFMVSPEKQIWHCFGCGKGGDVFSFVMEMEGVSFVEALKILAPKAGVQLKRQDPKIASQRNRLLDIMDLSSRYYHKVLMESGQAKAAYNYLIGRGLTEDTLEEWTIGYSPESWDDAINFLKSKGFKDNEIFIAGMSVKKEGANRFYNRFRGRIMFPIRDANGNVVAFSARVDPEREKTEKMGKYINSPQTPIYDKSKILFGLDKAKMAIKQNDLAVLVEGQMDAVTAHQNGFKNTIASSGTALTKEQIMMIKRYTGNIALAFDADEAGEMAAERGIREAMRADMNIKVIEIPSGKDPDECIKKDPAEWQSAVDKSSRVMDYYFHKTFSRFNPNVVEDKRKAAQILLSVIARIANRIEQDFWIKKLAEKIDVAENFLREALSSEKKSQNSYERAKPPAAASQKTGIGRTSRKEKLSEIFLVILLKFPLLIDYAFQYITGDHLNDMVNEAIYKDLIIYYNKNTLEKIDYNLFAEWIKGEKADEGYNQLKKLEKLVILGDKDYYEYDLEAAKKELIGIMNDLRKIFILEKRRELEKMIRELEEKDDSAGLEALFAEMKALSDELVGIEKE